MLCVRKHLKAKYLNFMKMDIFFFGDDEINLNLVLHAAEQVVEPLNLDNLEERQQIPKNANYFEETVPNYSDAQFQSHFRMSRNTFNVSTVLACYAKRILDILSFCQKISRITHTHTKQKQS